MLTARTFLVQGLLAGFIAGILTFGVAYGLGENPVDSAISFEESHSAEAVAADPAGTSTEADHTHTAGEAAEPAAHSHGDESEPVSRETQSTWGLATATIVFGTAIGGILALACAFAFGRLGRLRAQGTVAVVAAIGFVSVYFVPFLKYPANPPAVGNSDTIGSRTANYFGMLAISVIAAILAVVVVRRLLHRLGSFHAVLVGVAGFAAVTLLAAWALPIVDEVPADFPADVLWRFRMASLTIQATLWASSGLVLGWLIQRSLAKAAPAAARREPLVSA